jgi:hypothetical protein
MIEVIRQIYGGLYNKLLIERKKNRGGDSKEYINKFYNLLSDIINRRYDQYETRYLNFKDLVTSKYYTDQMVSCIRKSFGDKENIKSLTDVICSVNIYKYLTYIYQIPQNIKEIERYIWTIQLLVILILIINASLVFAYIVVTQFRIRFSVQYIMGGVTAVFILLLILWFIS